MNELIKLTPDGKTTSRELYEFLELNPTQYSRWCKSNIEENEFADEGTDYGLFDTNVENQIMGRPSTNYWLSIPFAKKLCMMSKSERGNQAREYFLEVERQFVAKPLPPMTPVQVIAAVAQQMAEQEQRMMAIEASASTAIRKVDFITETFVKRDEEKWRENINLDLNSISKATGIPHRDIKSESYELLEDRGHCRLSVRVQKARERLHEAGAKKTVIDGFCKLDAIEDDAKLKEIYTTIVKELIIKYMSKGIRA